MKKLTIKNLNAQFFYAVWGNDVNTCRDLIRNQEISVDGSHSDRNCALFTIPIFVAIQKNYKELFDACIEEFNANINIEWENKLPIDFAYQNHRTYMLEKLIEKKSDRSEYYFQLIHEDHHEKMFRAARMGDFQEVRRLLLEKKDEINKSNRQLPRLLTIAVENDDLELVKMLIEEFKFDKYDYEFRQGIPPAYKAGHCFSIKCMKYFAETDPKYKKLYFYNTYVESRLEIHSILYKAIKNGDTTLFIETYKKNKGAANWFSIDHRLNFSLLHIAVYHNRYDIAKEYIDIRALDNFSDLEYSTSSFDLTPLGQAFYDHNFKIMQLLIEKGAEYDYIKNDFEIFGLEVQDT